MKFQASQTSSLGLGVYFFVLDISIQECLALFPSDASSHEVFPRAVMETQDREIKIASQLRQALTIHFSRFKLAV